MQIPGLTQEEIFTHSRNIGNQDKGFKAKSTPYEVNKLLKIPQFVSKFLMIKVGESFARAPF